ncbi:TK protein kinase [Sphaeroforma arctica JP610]|uniref:TK protein kinase n=1 Tax=Sphaeroforma arctica JP610 TaxID=667725 RepID=A0A0L0G7J4_9EUKA|nr:TK protein kinase [Sphaeroforma arctica JP610]KNC84970.1 TK protein kinase [Sphaeroforma arctica JP610]|eukprot:XP_014158872.1 TK protein kinase [Sphaeroforma arctica JP610]
MATFAADAPIEMTLVQSISLANTIKNSATQLVFDINACADVVVSCNPELAGMEAFDLRGPDPDTSPNINSVKFEGFTVDSCTGRGIEIHATTSTVNDMTVTNCGSTSAEQSGAGISIDGASTYVSNSRFINNTLNYNVATAFGGGLYMGSMENATVTGCYFENNEASSGGALCGDSTYLVENSTFVNNRCFKNGCALLAQVRLEVVNSTLDGNSQVDAPGVSLGAGIFSRGDLTIRDSVMTNHFGGVGGCFFINDDTSVGRFYNTVFDSNMAVELAGVGNSNGALEFYNCTMTNNFCDFSSAVYSQADVSLEDCTVSDNTGIIMGAVTADLGVLTVDRCLFENNIASEAAALNTYNSGMFIRNSTFRNNKALVDWWEWEDLLKDPSGLQPGKSGVFSSVGKAEIENCLFENNEAEFDGGVARANTVVMTNVTARNNRAGQSGGVIMTFEKGEVITVRDSFIVDNSATTGGAFYSAFSNVVIENSQVVGNSAVLEGGAVWASQSATVTNSTFSCNQAKTGAAVTVKGVVVEVVPEDYQLTFMNNAGKTCTALFVGDGLICIENIANTCECEWAQQHIEDSCGANGVCQSTDSGAISCDCGEGEFYNGEMCLECSTCGLAASDATNGTCTATRDTLCVCDSGFTGPTCDTPCQLPANCTEGDASTCEFDKTNFGYKAICTTCDEGFFLNEDQSCIRCATCGDEGVPAEGGECSVTTNTVCTCPLGKTGLDCLEECIIPVGCTSVLTATASKCQFSIDNFSQGIECLNCAKDYYLDADIKQCVPITVCDEESYISKASTENSDRECTPYTVCAADEYESVEPKAREDRVCTSCSSTEFCTTVTSQCSATSDAVCSSCQSGKIGQACQGNSVVLTVDADADTWSDEDGEQLAIDTALSLGVPIGDVVYLGFTPGSVNAEMQFTDAASASLDNTLANGGQLPVDVTSVQQADGEPVAVGSEGSSLSTGLIVAIVLVSLFALAAVCAAVYFVWSRSRIIEQQRQKTVDEIVTDIRKQYKWLDHNDPTAQTKLDSVGREAGWLPRNQFALLDVLGKGAFGQVCRGVVFVEGTAVVCAIKQLLQNGDEAEFQKASDDFLREAQLLKGLDHRNVVRMIGVSMDEEMEGMDEAPSIYMLLEYMDLGDLKGYMQKRGENIDIGERLWFTREVSAGFAYLATIPVVHRDIAARNVLLRTNPHEGGYPYAKISDMGLARLTAGSQQNYVKQSEGGILPVRWMAPETLSANGVYTEASDVWGFAVCVWEVFADGAIPYDFCDNAEFIAIQRHASLRLNKPDTCPDHAYDTMLRCWQTQSEDRPKFSELAEIFDRLFFEQCPNYKDVEEFDENSEDGSHMDEVSEFNHKSTKDKEKLPAASSAYSELTAPNALDVTIDINERNNYDSVEPSKGNSNAQDAADRSNYDTLDSSPASGKAAKKTLKVTAHDLYVEVQQASVESPVTIDSATPIDSSVNLVTGEHTV